MCVMYCSDKLRSQEPEDFKHQFRCYLSFHLGTITLVLILSCITILELAVILLSMNLYHHELQSLLVASKIAQTVGFITYLYYMYRVSSDTRNLEIFKNKQPFLCKIGFAVGAVVGLMYILIFLQLMMCLMWM